MKKVLFAAVFPVFAISLVFAQNNIKIQDFTSDELDEISIMSKYSFQWCPKEYKDFLADTIDLRSCDYLNMI